MTFIWFILAVIFFILWISNRSRRSSPSDDQYNKGYNDGYHVVADKLAAELQKPKLDRASLHQIVYPATPAQGVTESEFIDDGSDRDDASFEVGASGVQEPQLTSVSNPPVVAVKTKAEITNRNLNILLYTASFLIIAAAAAFVATNMSASIRLTGVWLVTIAFYLTGVVLYKKMSFLRPAAVAFIGTGLAIVPFAGVAFAQLGGIDSGIAWLITSIAGVIMYGYAALSLKSEVVAYLTIAASLSFAASTVASVSAPMIYYFVILILVSLVFHILARLKVKWIPELFKVPINQTGHLLAPVTVAASLLAYGVLAVADYQVIFWVITLYYVVLLATENRYVYEIAVRILVSVAILVTVANIEDVSLTMTLWALLGILSVQVLYSLIRFNKANPRSRMREMIWLIAIWSLLLVTLPYWFAAFTPRLGVISQTATLFVTSILATLRFRRAYLATPALLSSIALIFLAGEWLIVPPASPQVVSFIFIGAALFSVGIYLLSKKQYSKDVQLFLEISFWVYASMALLVAAGQMLVTEHLITYAVFAVLTFGASYIFKRWWAEILTVPFVFVSWLALFRALELEQVWVFFWAVVLSLAAYIILAIIHHLRQEHVRRSIWMISSAAVGVGFAGMAAFSVTPVTEVSFGIVLALIIAAFIGRLKMSSDLVSKGVFSFVYIFYPFAALLLAANLGLGWIALVTALAAGIYYAASYIERQPSAMVIANIAVVVALVTLWRWLEFDMSWMSFGVAWITAAIFYASHLYFIHSKENTRATIQLVSTWIILGAVILFNFFSFGRPELAFAAAYTLVAMAASVVYHGKVSRRDGVIELGIYIGTFGLQRLVGLAMPEITPLVYAHWWTVVIALVALWHSDKTTKARLIVALSFVTFSSGVTALIEGGGYQILFLVEHVILLVVGALTRTSWALWWGLGATIVAVLYFLKSSLFLSLLFLGLTLLLIVIWRLIKANKTRKK